MILSFEGVLRNGTQPSESIHQTHHRGWAGPPPVFPVESVEYCYGGAAQEKD